LLLSKTKKPPIPSEPRLFEANKKAAALRGSRLASFLVNPSKTPSRSPRAYEYDDAKDEKPAVRQRLMDHKIPFQCSGWLHFYSKAE